MKTAALCLLCLVPLSAATRYNGREWKLDEKETLSRTFDGAQKLLVDNLHGFVHVTGTSGSKIEISIEKHMYADSAEALAEAKRDVKMDIDRQGNLVRAYEDGPFRTHNGTNYRGDDYYRYRVVFDFEVKVPVAAELVLKNLNNGITVRNTTGDYELHCLNGEIEMEQISGTGTVQTLNGKIKVGFARNPSKPAHFKTLNGTVDVYFQKELNADLRFKKLNGAIYTDFDVTSLPVTGASGKENGKFVYRTSGKMAARAGKGGPELSFETLNGSIRLHTKAL